ncbi:MAG: flagellar filament capping protein FliD [candidate division Zixibacteria bacterium]|nr:flagellar filament capping protein FliD [candidate division Zixibacteria bacterium]
MPGANSIDGLNSGFDTTAIVDSIINYERRNAVLLESDGIEKTNIITAYKALQAKVLALSAAVGQLTHRSTFNAATARVSDESILTATTSGRVATGSYQLQVLDVARNHQLASQGISEADTQIMGTGTIEITVGNGSQYSIDINENNNSLIGIKQAINDAHMGITATIINDGSSSNSYRLMLTGDKTGRSNTMEVTSNLTGGTNLNYSTALFDSPEILSSDSVSSSTVTLDSMASYSGNENKIYTFTVLGTGAQTIGTDEISIEWTDGTNSGQITVTQADASVELVGDGADGLKLSFSTGDLTAGDSFQVAGFAPLIQEASDARISFGAGGGTGSPIIVTSESNTFDSVIAGVTLDISRETEVGESVTVTTDIDVSGIKAGVNDFITRYNDVMDFVSEQNTYHEDTKESGVLFGDSTLWTMRYAMNSAIGMSIEGMDSEFNHLYSLGIRTNLDGHLAITDYGRFEEALRNNLDEVVELFTDGGVASQSGIEFVSSSTATKTGKDYQVDISVAAAKGMLEGTTFNDPLDSPLTLTSATNTIKLKVNGLNSNDIVLSARTYSSADELVEEIQGKIDNDSRIGSRGVIVEWVDEGSTGYLKFTSGAYGSSSKVERLTSVSNSANSSLGLIDATSTEGLDVAGTINGEEAEGIGQLLKGKDDNETTEGLTLRITLDPTEVGEGVEGSITVTKGVAARLRDKVASYSMSGDGALDRRIKAYETQIEHITERVAEIDERLVIRREMLYQKFYEMERALGEFNATGTFLETQLANLDSNWNFNKKK